MKANNLVFPALILVSFACSGHGTSGGGADSTVPGFDTLPGSDSRAETMTPDAATDLEVPPDLLADTLADLLADTLPDTSPDTPPDAPPDALTDTAPDLPPDVPVGCQSNDDCLGSPDGELCDPDTGGCVHCLSDGDCLVPTPYCGGGACVACAEDAQCTDPLLPFCDPASGTCVECAASWQCIYPAHLCDPADQTCVQCIGPQDCPFSKPLCMAGTDFCVECLGDGDCPVERPFCDGLNHACFECQSDGDCGGAQPYCASAFGTCQACMNVSDCGPGQKCFFSACVDLASGPDADADTVADAVDNCPQNSNWDQANLDGDGLGDACDDDIDGDGLPDIEDNCPAVSNPDQLDLDGNGWGDLCDGGGGASSDRTCGTLGYPTAVQFFEGFEKGQFLGWFIPDGTAGTWTPGYTMDYVAPTVTAAAAHGGQFGVHFPNVTWPSEANHQMELELCMPLTSEVTFSTWVRPDNVGYCCGQYGTAALNVSFLKGTQGYTLSFLWSYSSQVDSGKHHLFHMDDPPFSWVEGQWNLLQIDLQQALADAFSFTDFSNVLITKIVAYNHYSNGSPQGFDIDDLELIPVP